jgi:hypothetical protein
MKRLAIPLILSIIILVFLSCNRKRGELLTDRILYDVTIESPETDLEWWVQNLENHKREQLVKSIISASQSGENKVYDVLTNKELSEKEIADRSKRKQLMTMSREDPPYEEYDTLVEYNIELSDISKIRFLEEWYLNEETGLITKKVIGICPMLESYTEAGELRGHIPLYWISFVKKFPLAQ